MLDPFRLVVIALFRWINLRQLLIIDYLREETRSANNLVVAGRNLTMTNAVD